MDKKKILTVQESYELFDKILQKKAEYAVLNADLLKNDPALYNKNIKQIYYDVYQEYGINYEDINNPKIQLGGDKLFLEKINNIKPVIDKPDNKLWLTYRKI